MEDFVPFELAKKLKEKGFKQKCLAYYDVEDNVGLLYNTQYTDEALPCQYTDLLQCHNTGEAETQSDDSGFCVDAPTISQVLKWLFDEKQLFANIDCNICDKFGLFFTIYKKGEETWEACGFDDNYYNKPEEAILAGIDYVLDNLI